MSISSDLATTSAPICFLGDGAWGTALAIILAEKGRTCRLWGHFPEAVAIAKEKRVNETFLPGVPLPDGIEPTDSMTEALDGAALIVISTPVVHVRKVLEGAREQIAPGTPIVAVCKGIEQGTMLRGSQVVADVIGDRPTALLMGPSHAEEVSHGQPTSVVSALTDQAFAEQVQALFMTDLFRVYTSTDPIGVELGAALKNVIAIAAGISDGLGFGDNAKAALVTRGLAEIARLGDALGADRATFAGLAGLGDLITTCVSPHGRNLRVGRAIGAGKTLDEVLADLDKVVPEGVWTCRSALALSEKCGVEMPITREVCNVLFQNKPALDAVRDLMTRDPRPELDAS